MAQKCPHCQKKIVRWPIKSDDGIIIWKNLLKMDWYSVLMFIIILLVAFSYKQDIAECDKVIEDPCGFCKESNCCELGIVRNSKPVEEQFVYVDNPSVDLDNFSFG